MSAPKFVIVIGRQYGSGGRELGKRLAERLNIPYYDKELLIEAAGRLGFRMDLLEKVDEKPPSPLRSLLAASVGSSSWFSSGALQSETLYQLQSDVIRAILDREACVIVGRTADYIARSHPGLVSIFLHADISDRIARVAGRDSVDLSGSDMKEAILRKDNARRDYYNYFTGRDWGAASNYHLSLSSSLLDMEGIEAVVMAYLKARGFV